MTAIDGFAPNVHRVAVLAFDGVVPFDLAVPCEVFARAGSPPAYEVRVCGASERVQAALFELRPSFGLEALAEVDTVVVPGIDDIDKPVPAVLLEALRSAHARGARIASVCSGAFLLAAAGLLDGRRATTHWLAAAELARRYPRVQVDPAVLYVDEGQVLTSAGAAAGLDLCLHLVYRDLGAAAAAQTARLSVMPLERAGGQAQFIAWQPPPPEGASLAPVLRWMEESLHQELSLPTLARKAVLSQRTFLRRFREQTGTTPSRWLTRARVRRAQHLLETTALSMEEIAQRVGFGAATTLRERFAALVGTSPTSYRNAFRGRSKIGPHRNA